MYEFSCRKCGHQFEDLVSLAEVEAGEVECPACGSKDVERGFSTFATNGGDSFGGGYTSSGCGSGGFT